MNAVFLIAVMPLPKTVATLLVDSTAHARLASVATTTIFARVSKYMYMYMCNLNADCNDTSNWTGNDAKWHLLAFSEGGCWGERGWGGGAVMVAGIETGVKQMRPFWHYFQYSKQPLFLFLHIILLCCFTQT